MTIQNERPQEKRLKKLGLRIVTTFWDNGRIRRRSSDLSDHDDVANGVIMDKKYYRDDVLLHTETVFNPLMLYSFVIGDQMEKETTCPNCGARGRTADFSNGCPYCGTYCNIRYSERKNAGKLSAEKKALKPAGYIPAFLICMGVFVGAGLLLVRMTGRTFGLFDILKGTAFGGIAGLLAFWLYCARQTASISRKDEERYRQQLERMRAFENRLAALDIPVNVFYNNLYSELNNRFFDDKRAEYADIADWDILDYDNYDVHGDRENSPAISLTADIRIIRMRDNRLYAKPARIHAVMKPDPAYEGPLQPGIHVIRCRRCGNSIDITKPVCDHCGTVIRYRQRCCLEEMRITAP